MLQSSPCASHSTSKTLQLFVAYEDNGTMELAVLLVFWTISLICWQLTNELLPRDGTREMPLFRRLGRPQAAIASILRHGEFRVSVGGKKKK